MKNKPNMFRVNFQVQVDSEDTHPSSVVMVSRFGDITNLADVRQFNNITTVVPIYIEVSSISVTSGEINAAINEAIRLQEETQNPTKLVNNVLRLQKELAEAEVKLSEANITIEQS